MIALDINQPRISGRWTKEEHEKFLYGLKLYGKNWKKIQDLIQTRTSTQIRSHAQKFFIKVRKAEKGDEDSENLDNYSHSKLSQETLLTPMEEQKIEKEKSLFSFFFEKIAKNYASYEKQGRQFNFWESLVDCPKVQKYRSCEILQIPRDFELDLRKINSSIESAQSQKSSSLQLIRTQFSCFEEYHSQN